MERIAAGMTRLIQHPKFLALVFAGLAMALMTYAAYLSMWGGTMNTCFGPASTSLPTPPYFGLALGGLGLLSIIAFGMIALGDSMNRFRTWVASLAPLSYVALMAWSVFGDHPQLGIYGFYVFGTYEMMLISAPVALGLGLGLAMGTWWSRWVGLGLALLGVVFYGASMLITTSWQLFFAYAVMASGALITMALLMGSSMGNYVEGRVGNPLWRLTHEGPVRRLFIAMISTVAVLPTLLLISFSKLSVLAIPALPLAALLLTGLFLCAWRRSFGLHVLALGGVGLIAMTIQMTFTPMPWPVQLFFGTIWCVGAIVTWYAFLGFRSGLRALKQEQRV